MRPKTKTAASFMILVLLLMPSKLWAQDPPKKTESPPAQLKLTVKKTWINCFWSSRDKRGNPRPPSNPAGRIAKQEAASMHLRWTGFDVATESDQRIFLAHVGADNLPDPFADRLVLQRFFDTEELGGVPATEFLVLDPTDKPDVVKKKFLAYLDRTATPPPSIPVSTTEWKPDPECPPSTNIASATHPVDRVASANPNK